jgi:hypothetical protein
MDLFARGLNGTAKMQDAPTIAMMRDSANVLPASILKTGKTVVREL